MSSNAASNSAHNATVLEELNIGDMVEFPRGLYSHWGVYFGNEQIVHLAGDDNAGVKDAFNSGSVFTICGKMFNKAYVRIDNFWDVAKDCKAVKNNSKDRKLSPRPAREIVKAAKAKVGEVGYNVVWNNCEQFAAFLRYGVKWSEQVDTAFEVAVGVGAAAVVGGLLLANPGKRKT